MNIYEIEKALIEKEKISKQDVLTLLDYIVLRTNEIVEDKTYLYKCDLVQGIIGRYLEKLGVEFNPCITNKCIANNVEGHSFLVADFLSNGKYIIDPAYIQFFYHNDKYDDLYIKNFRVKSKSPFYYGILLNKNIMSRFIKKGYMELTEETAYAYGNSFYYTLTNVDKNYDFKPIDGEILKSKFLLGEEPLRKYDTEEINISYNKSFRI